MRRLRQLLATTGLGLLSAAGGGVAVAYAEKGVPSVTVDGNPAAGNSVRVAQGQVMTVELSGQPGTGYAWAVRRPIPDFVKELDGTSAEGAQVPGGWQRQRLNFKIVGQGQGTLHFGYRRSWEKGAKDADAFSVKVIAE